ncbi:uncharacterized protein LOC131326967 isoform X2 [Rhododendron vialii]|nr:uncharacterized protein LOC131326967 isoform X2 [Rhododendron vialii]
MDLPKFVVFNSLSNKNYLRPGGTNGYMKFEAMDVGRWGVKHEVQKAKTGGGLIHIRCCDTGKYWTWGLTKDSVQFITAQADQPGEDTTTRACTLIKPSHNTKDGVKVVNLEVMYVGEWWPIGGNKKGYLVSGDEDFIISHWESLPANQSQEPSIGDKNMDAECIGATLGSEEMDLPKFVSFNSLLNKNYLHPDGINSYIKFGAVDVISWGVKHEVQKAKSGGGLIHIRCCDTGKYWSWGLTDYSKSFIVTQANQPGEDTTTRACTLIKPSQYTKDGVNVVNLQVMYEGTWWSIGGDDEGYLVTGGEDFIISDWELLPPIGNEEMDLPKFVVFNSLSNENYLRPGGINSFMKFEVVDVIKWGVKHEVQKAKYGGGLVHIRCCDTSKYWSWGLTTNSVNFITAQADQPGEDTTTRACTLIKPSHNTKDGVKVVNLQVMYQGKWLSVGKNEGGYLVAGDEDFIVSNWEMLPPNQLQGLGDKNMNTGGTGASIGSEKIAFQKFKEEMDLPKFEEEVDLPKFVVFNSLLNKNYLRPEGANSYMKFEVVDAISWGVKHEVMKKKSEGGLVHIRCCDTGKYWSWGLTDYSRSYIVAQANHPVEDTTTRACTLIKPSQYTKDGVSVVNLQVMYEGTWWSIGGDNEGYLVTGGEDFIISDWELLPPIGNEEKDLPKFVVFNSLSNENYLRPGGINSYMKFEVMDVVKWGVKHEVQKAKYGGGLVHIRCCDTSKYWSWGLTTDSVNFITAQADQLVEDTTTRACTLIKPSYNTKDGVKFVNLQVMYQGKWLSVGRNERGYLVAGDEDFIVSNWEMLPPNQLQGLGDKNINTGGTGASIGSEKMAFQKFKEEMDLPKFEEEVDLPKFVVFNSLLNKNYLRPEGTNSYMKFEVVDAISWGGKHEVMKKKSGGGLVHIRCCDTGKYWSWGLTDYSRSYIVAQANHPVEDTTTRACTLIKPSQYTKDGVSVVNLQVMHKGTWWSIGGDGGGYLVTGGEDFIISDWELLPPNQPQGPSVGDKNMYTGGTSASTGNEEMNLPEFEEEMHLTKIVVFNSLLNKNYLRPVGQNCYMKFDQTANVGSWGVKHEIQMSESGGGLVHIRCDNGKCWAWGSTKDSVDFITAQANQPGEDASIRACTLIKPSFNTKDGVSAINLEVMYQGTWWPIGGDSRGYLKVGGEDFIVSDWESLPPKQPQGASDGDKNTNTEGGVLIGDTTIEGGVSFGSSKNISASVSIGNTTVNYQLLATQIPQEVVRQLGSIWNTNIDGGS